MSENDVAIVAMESQIVAGSEKLHGRMQRAADSDAGPTADDFTATPTTNAISLSVSDRKGWGQKLLFVGSICAWYTFGIVAIVTSKILVQEWKCPPLILTVQQMVLGNSILRFVLYLQSNIQPWPWEQTVQKSVLVEKEVATADKFRRFFPWVGTPSFILVGIFNALDFLCSNFAFSMSAAHFVETIKASDPITTATIAVLGNVDRLNCSEGTALIILVIGVILSTLGNASEAETATEVESDAERAKLMESVTTASLVLLANICFGLRALFQKRYRLSNNRQIDDTNLFFRMMQVGATVLLIPVCIMYASLLQESLNQPSNVLISYAGFAATNACSYVIYK